MKKEKELEFVSLDRECFCVMMGLLGIDRHKMKCYYCKQAIDKNNFGVLQKDVFVCNNKKCLYDYVGEGRYKMRC
jgi:hypothetical protein